MHWRRPSASTDCLLGNREHEFKYEYVSLIGILRYGPYGLNKLDIYTESFNQPAKKDLTMAEQKKNALVLKGINDDITELKSLATLRKRLVSDGEIVSKSENGFRPGRGNTGVILRNDGRDFHMLTTKDGEALNGQWNTLRPFSFNLKTGSVSLHNGVDISGGAVVSHNASIFAKTTGPDPLINGQPASSCVSCIWCATACGSSPGRTTRLSPVT
jgi:hypothetical protein